MNASVDEIMWILVDCPTVAYISALTSASNLESFYSGSGKTVNCIVHLSPSSVTNCIEYRGWMRKFKEAHHIMAGRHGYFYLFCFDFSLVLQVFCIEFKCSGMQGRPWKTHSKVKC